MLCMGKNPTIHITEIRTVGQARGHSGGAIIRARLPRNAPEEAERSKRAMTDPLVAIGERVMEIWNG